jgi:uncharacterized OsmC-like protein
MSDQSLRYTVRSTSSGVLKRSLNAVRNHHIVIDSPSVNEEITSGEAFLLGVSSCGVTLIEGAAEELGIPLERIEVDLSAFQNPDDRDPRFVRIDMTFTLFGVGQEQADVLVGRYRDG